LPCRRAEDDSVAARTQLRRGGNPLSAFRFSGRCSGRERRLGPRDRYIFISADRRDRPRAISRNRFCVLILRRLTESAMLAHALDKRHETQFSNDDGRRRSLGSHFLFRFQRRRGRDAVVPLYREWSDYYFGKLDVLVFHLQIRGLPHDGRAKTDTRNFDAVGPTRCISSRGRPVRR
jgi:hypothetical protein